MLMQHMMTIMLRALILMMMAYISHGDGSDDIDVSLFVDLVHGEPGDSQEQQVKKI